MKNIISTILSRLPILTLMVWTAFLAVSCAEKELVFGGEDISVKIDFDWENASAANPKGMTLIFFPADKGSLSWKFDITERDGGDIELLSGVYNILAFNNDLPGLAFTNTDSFDLFSATPRSIADTLKSPTGMLYSAVLTEVALFKSDDSPKIIRMKPDSLSTVYHITIDSVSGTQRIKTANAVVKGIARSVCLRLQCNSADSCCMSAPLHIAPDVRTDSRPSRPDSAIRTFPTPRSTLT